MRRNLFPGLNRGNAVFVGVLLAVPLAAYLLQNSVLARWLLLILGVGMLVPMLKAAFESDTTAKHRVFVFLILWVFHTAFWAMFEQAGSSLTLLAENYTNRFFTWPSEWEFKTTWFQSVNPAFIVLLAPLFTLLWKSLQRIDRDPTIPMKFGLGVVLLALGYVVLVWGMRHFSPGAVTPFRFLFLAYVMHTMGELCLSPVGLSAVTKLAPEKAVGFFMGFWFLSISAAQNIAGAIAGETASTTVFAEMTVDQKSSQLGHYADVYWQGALILLGMGVFLMIISRLVNKLAHGVR